MGKGPPFATEVNQSSNKEGEDESDDYDNDVDGSSKKIVHHLHEDRHVPIFSHKKNFTYSEAVLSPCLDKVCAKQPIAVKQNAAFLVDLSKLEDVDDINSDDCGHWIHKGTKSTKTAVWKTKDKVLRVVCVDKQTKTPPDENSCLYTLSRVYYPHDPHSDFKRTYYYLDGMCS